MLLTFELSESTKYYLKNAVRHRNPIISRLYLGLVSMIVGQYPSKMRSYILHLNFGIIKVFVQSHT